ncbi:DUF4214 domain-containing protein, partial [Pseudoalteromonas sp. SSM20]|uniref:DUF4214 domain-containing protein n=1 Tax=Pseudoalteromonas sp. SSM20 TaxID=3139394 RepID=UPI003BAB7BEC
MKFRLYSCLLMLVAFISFDTFASFAGKKWADISTGKAHTMALDYKGDIWVWGANNNSQLGLGNGSPIQSDKPIRLSIQENQTDIKFTKIFSGPNSSFALSESGDIWSWGSNSKGVLGQNAGNAVIQSLPTKITLFREQSVDGEGVVTLVDVADVKFSDLKVYNSAVIAKSLNSKYYIWGDNQTELFGANLPQQIIQVPTEVNFNINETTTVSGIFVTDGYFTPTLFVLLSNGEIYSKGDNYRQTTGTGHLGTYLSEFKVVQHPNNLNWKTLHSIKETVIAVDSNGDVYRWGFDAKTPKLIFMDSGETEQFKPFSQLPSNLNEVYNRISVGYNQTAIIADNGDLFLWGKNDYFSITHEEYVNFYSYPTKYVNTRWNSLNKIGLHDESVVVLSDSREIYTWGSNYVGALGYQSNYLRNPAVGQSAESRTPSQGYSFSNISTSYDSQQQKAHTLAIKVTGICYPNMPQLDSDNNPATFNPANYDNDSVCSLYSTLEKEEKYGEIWGWGNNSFNQLTSTILDPNYEGSNDKVIDYPSPIFGKSVNDISLYDKSWRFIETSGSSSYAIDTAGKLYSWGRNNYGQLGLGIADSIVSNPTEVTGNTWHSISASSYHVIAIDTSNRLFSWGNNWSYKLGTGDNVWLNLPTEISAGITLSQNETWLQVATSIYFSTAITSEGRRFVWGSQENGRLGNNSKSGVIAIPTYINDGFNWQRISASDTYTVGVANNKLYIWGDNIEQTLEADPDVTLVEPHRLTPGEFPDGSDIKTVTSFNDVVSSNDTHYALDNNRAWVWGSGSNGWLGDGTLSVKQVLPKLTATSYEISAISTSGKSTAAIDISGLLLGWGDNQHNQLGFSNTPGKIYSESAKVVLIDDADGDGTPNYLDVAPENHLLSKDSDYDGIADENDSDSDNDGLEDDLENSLAFQDSFDATDANQDLDRDGLTVKKEYLTYYTCDSYSFEGTLNDPNCSTNKSLPKNLSVEYLAALTTKYNELKTNGGIAANVSLDSFLNTFINRRYFSFESNDLGTVSAWYDEQYSETATFRERAEARIANNSYVGFKTTDTSTEVTPINTLYTAADSYNGSQSLMLTSTNSAVSFNRGFGKRWSSYIEDLTSGEVFFAYKTNDAFLAGADKLELLVVGHEYNHQSTFTDRVLWSSTSKSDVNINDGWILVSVNNPYTSEQGAYQLTWRLTKSTGNHEPQIYLDALSFPLELNNNPTTTTGFIFPIEYRDLIVGVNTNSADPDNDGLSNKDEYLAGTNPNNLDTDGDKIPDGWEVLYGANPLVDDANADLDNDTLSNYQEYLAGTNPKSTDSDNDGLPDGWEVANGTNPVVADANGDSDGDGLTNKYEYDNGLDAGNNDQDNDGIIDGQDNDPLVAADSDGDGWDNAIERSDVALDESNPNDAWADSDNDGRPLVLEGLESTNSGAKDNDVVGQTRNLVIQAYVDTMSFSHIPSAYLTDLGAGSTEIDLKIADVNGGNLTPAQLYHDLLLDSNSDFAVMGFIGRTYKAVLDREVNLSGATFYREVLSTGRMTQLAMVTNFVNSTEFTNRYGNDLSSEAFVTLVYQNVLG